MFSSKLSRRRFLTGAAITAAGMALAACAPKATPAPTPAPKPAAGQPTAAPAQPTPAPAKKEPVVIREQGGGNAIVFPFHEKCIKEKFMAEHPEIKVELEPNPDGWVEKLLTQMVAGTAPDLFEAWGNILYEWVDRNLIFDLQPLVDRDFTKERIEEYTEFQWKGLVFKGIRAGMPRYINIILMYIHKDLWDKYGVPYPPEDGNYTFDDYTGWLKTLTEKARSKGDNNVWAGWIPMDDLDRFWTPIHSWGGKVVDEKYGKVCLLGEPEAQAALKWAYDMEFTWNYHSQPAQVENKWPSTSFGPGLIMSAIEGVGWLFTRERVWGEEAKIRYDLRHHPKGPTGKRSTLGTTDCWSVNKATKHPEEVWTLLQFLAGPVYQMDVAIKVNGQIPVLKSLIKDYPKLLREVKPRLEDVRLETVTEAIEWGYPEDGPWFCDQLEAFNTYLGPALQKVYTVGDVGPDYLIEVANQITEAQNDCVVTWPK